MANFQQHKRDGDVWYSPPVYTHHQGYKICLEVHGNGYGDGKGTHVSVYIALMKGEFDDCLKWPFRGVIAFRLLDQVTGEDHRAYEVTYDDSKQDKYCNRVISGERTGGWGKARFIAHSELESKYIQKDTLFFSNSRSRAVHTIKLLCTNCYFYLAYGLTLQRLTRCFRGFLSGAATIAWGLKVHTLPLTDTRTSPEGNTLVTRPAWPSDWGCSCVCVCVHCFFLVEPRLSTFPWAFNLSIRTLALA